MPGCFFTFVRPLKMNATIQKMYNISLIYNTSILYSILNILYIYYSKARQFVYLG